MIHPDELPRIEAEIDAEIAAAVAFAEAGTWEPVEQLTRFTYAERCRASRCNAMKQEPIKAEMVEMTYREAVRAALRDAIKRDERVFLMGEDVGRYGGCYAVSHGLLAEFGPERIRDTPLSESGFTGAGIGAAMAGMRPIVELMTVNFSLLALDQILNTAATVRHMSGNQFGVPLVIRMATGAGRQLAAQHSHSLEGWYAHIPGIKVLAPATLEDARGMLWTALQDPDPVLIFENVMLYNMTGKLAADAGPVDIDKAAVRRAGRDISLITYGGSLWKTLEAATALAAEGIEAEVIDLRSLRPLDDATIMASVAKTRRRGHRRRRLAQRQPGGGSRHAYRRTGILVARRADRPRLQRGGADSYPRHLENAAIPQAPKIVAAAKAALGDHKGTPWSTSACPPLAPTWKPARWWNGWSSPAIGSSAAISSRWSRRRKARSRSKPSSPARSKRSWSISTAKCRSGRRWRRSERRRKSKPLQLRHLSRRRPRCHPRRRSHLSRQSRPR